jgi:hypothetical protein
MKSIGYLILATISLASCTKVVDLNLDSNNNAIVIQGAITNQPGPYLVKLSKSVNFTESNNYPSIDNAIVTISDNTGQLDTLTHTANGVYTTHTIQGITGNTYNLKVIADGKVYNASSTMPAVVNFDSISIVNVKFAGQERNNLIPIYKDPNGLGNNYNFIVYDNGVKSDEYFLQNDNVNDGNVNQIPLQSPTIDVKSGDTATVEMQCVDASIYNYYFTLAQIGFSGPGGGTTPSNPPNNISGGALGIFSAHTTQTKSVVIP